ncbi:MAG: hypothetical protein M3457_15380 [Chloroflexota bacterium]|nr:hypothetical protein [Chloroflexota bacterium]
MSHKETESALVSNTRISIEDIDALSMIGDELTEDELAWVSGAQKPIYIGKTFFDDGSVESDWIVGD